MKPDGEVCASPPPGSVNAGTGSLPSSSFIAADYTPVQDRVK